jgi:arylsulfatase A-like enzyme
MVLGLGILTAAAVSAGCAQQSGAGSAERPNVIVIMADDMGYSDIGSYGSEISTPNLDRLAESGLRFRQFYNNAKCSPTRASLLTGLYPHEAGMGDLANGAPGEPGPYQGYLPENSVTIAEVLRTGGYRTYMSGKWHIGDLPEHWPHSRGFDRYFGLISGATSFFELLPEPGRDRQMVMEDRLWQPPGDGFYATDAYNDYAATRMCQSARAARMWPIWNHGRTSPIHRSACIKTGCTKGASSHRSSRTGRAGSLRMATSRTRWGTSLI